MAFEEEVAVCGIALGAEKYFPKEGLGGKTRLEAGEERHLARMLPNIAVSLACGPWT